MDASVRSSRGESMPSEAEANAPVRSSEGAIPVLGFLGFGNVQPSMFRFNSDVLLVTSFDSSSTSDVKKERVRQSVDLVVLPD